MLGWRIPGERFARHVQDPLLSNYNWNEKDPGRINSASPQTQLQIQFRTFFFPFFLFSQQPPSICAESLSPSLLFSMPVSVCRMSPLCRSGWKDFRRKRVLYVWKKVGHTWCAFLLLSVECSVGLFWVMSGYVSMFDVPRFLGSSAPSPESRIHHSCYLHGPASQSQSMYTSNWLLFALIES